MDSDGRYVQEYTKYSFLLGSALRNEDSEQFLSIYDSLLPCNLPDIQVETIKTRAREIAELSDPEFSRLFANARDFSLAHGPQNMSVRKGVCVSTADSAYDDESDLRYIDEDDDDESSLAGQPTSTPTYSEHTKSSVFAGGRGGSRTCLADEDSGMFNATLSVDSASDREDPEKDFQDACLDYYPSRSSYSQSKPNEKTSIAAQVMSHDGDDKSVVFDYYPTQIVRQTPVTTQTVRQTPITTLHMPYDEAYEVVSDKDSVTDSDSPRDNSIGSKDDALSQYKAKWGGQKDDSFQGTEMKTIKNAKYSQGRIHMADDVCLHMGDDSDDDDLSKVSVHKRLYQSPYLHSYTQKASSSFDDREYGGYSGRYEQSKISFPRSQPAKKETQSAVFDSISFSQLKKSSPEPKYSSHYQGARKKTSSDLVKIEKSFAPRQSQKTVDLCVSSNRPPYEIGERHFEKVQDSIQPLLISLRNVPAPNMPEGTPVSTESRDKETKKKKRSSKVKTDGASTSSSKDTDENGNPLEKQSLLIGYHQMRQSPNTSQHVDAVTNQISYGATHSHVFPHELDCFDSYTLPGQDQPIKDLDDTRSNTFDGNSGRHQKRRKAKKERLQVTKSEDIPNYMGRKPIDNIIDFIENNQIKKTKKANHPTAVTANAVPNTNGKNDSKTDKKCKDKKQKNCMQNCCVNSDVELVNASIERTTNIVNITDASTKKTELQCIMGNSGNKLISENHEIMVDLPASGTIPVECEKYEPNNGDSDAVTVQDSQPISIECEKKENVHIKMDGEEQSVLVENQSIITHPMGADAASVNGVTNPLLTEDVDKPSASSIDNVASAMRAEGGEASNFNDLNPSVVDTGISGDPFDIADYIFTDVDAMAPIEPEFTVVGKKKKPRSIVRDYNRQAFIPRNNFRGDRKFVNNKYLRSVTPPPPQSVPAKLSIEKERTQDLSPNAFPALENNASPKCRTPSLHEGRRNSTGDVPTDLSMKCQDDSDLESVKSLPAQGELLDPLSPGIHHVHLSYARIAASPRSSSSNASAASSSTCNHHLTASRSHTEQFTPPSSPKSLNVWKGSPTERRHSLGASPDGSKGDNLQSITKSLRQKCGSQELPKFDDPAVDTLKSPACRQLQSEFITCPSSRAEVVSASTSSSAQSSVCEESLGALGTSVNNVKIAKSAFMKAKPVTTNINTVSSSSTVQQQSSPPVKGTNNNQGKRYKPQSVIFLDNKRDSNLPQNLGISFGFEDSDYVPSNSVNNQLIALAVKDDSMNNLPDSGITSYPISPSSAVSSTSPTPKTVSKDVCIPPVNGLVQHKLSVQDVRNCQFNSSDITFFASDPDGAQTANPIGDNNCQVPSKSKLGNHVIVHYGEAVVSNNGCSKPCGQLIFRVEVNNQGNFNVQQAARFLKKEWDRVKGFQQRYPDAVMEISCT